MKTSSKHQARSLKHISPEEAQSLRELFSDELKDIYWTEKALTKAIPNMIKNSTSEELIQALIDHLEETKEHIARLEQVFFSIGDRVMATRCEVIADLLEENTVAFEEMNDGFVLDAYLVSRLSKMQHFKIATYRTLLSFAGILGEDRSAALLQEILEEEKRANEKLSEFAESFIPVEA